MLAANEQIDLDEISYPKMASGKIDGVRAHCQGGKTLSRSNKESLNPWVRTILSHSMFDGLDGELTTVGNLWNDFNENQSVFMTQSTEKFPFIFHVFDDINLAHLTAEERKENILDRVHNLVGEPAFKLIEQYIEVRCVQQHEVRNAEDVTCLYGDYRAKGYEGLILCKPDAVYKHGRSTLKQEIMLKVKPSCDSEMIVESFDVAVDVNGMPLGRVGAIKGKWGDVRIELGTGFDHDLAKLMWHHPDLYVGKWAKFKYMELTKTGQPRHAVFVGFRHPGDM